MINKLTTLTRSGTPFLVISDFKADKLLVYTIDELQNEDIEFSMSPSVVPSQTLLRKHPISFETYKKGFAKIITHIKRGETYLLNYTCTTPIETPLTLREIYTKAHAKFKLRFKNEFVCFSPEPFINITNNTISTYPMKGTIDANSHNAEAVILADEKELAEHIMVVDLLRNDLGIVATKIKVKRFRYVERLETGEKSLLQVSSHISGTLQDNWRENFGPLLKKLLPAGSITGTPKRSTIEIIEAVETHQRGFFTGVFGYFDGHNFDSAVMIRFVENRDGKLFYKSGGGITLESSCKREYQEMLDKVYIP